MKTVWTLLGVVAALTVVLVGCQGSHQAEADPVQFTLGKEFALGGGQEAVLLAENLRVRFTDVLEDSRCPREVECFWSGQARIAVQIEPAESPTTTASFNTNPAPGQNVQTVRVGGYAISLTSLGPLPQRPDEPIDFHDYQAGLIVRR